MQLVRPPSTRGLLSSQTKLMLAVICLLRVHHVSLSPVWSLPTSSTTESIKHDCCMSYLPCRYTAGVYSLLPGGLEALPRFDDSDFQLPAEAKTSISCFGVTRTLETESDDSDSDSPRHHRTNGETPVCTPLDS